MMVWHLTVYDRLETKWHNHQHPHPAPQFRRIKWVKRPYARSIMTQFFN